MHFKELTSNMISRNSAWEQICCEIVRTWCEEFAVFIIVEHHEAHKHIPIWIWNRHPKIPVMQIHLKKWEFYKNDSGQKETGPRYCLYRSIGPSK